MDALVLLPVGALVLLSSLRFDGAVEKGGLCGMAVGVVFCLFLGWRSMIPDEVVFFASEVSRRVRAQIEEFRNSEARDFVVVEGSSVAAYGCNPEVLHNELQREGLDVGVLQFSAQGANHFERAFFLEAFWRGLTASERDRFREGRVVLMREIFDAYDKEPLYLFEKDSYTERAKVYMSPGYAWAAGRAFSEALPEDISTAERWRREAGMGALLVERVLLNRFGAGALSGMDWRARKRKTGAFFALEGEKGNFDYEAMVSGMEAWTDSLDSGFEIPKGWGKCRDFLQERTAGWVDSEVFFAIPTVEGNRREYQAGFQNSVEGLVLGPPDREGMKEFVGKEFWSDGVHPTGAGAERFSRWLARELAKALTEGRKEARKMESMERGVRWGARWGARSAGDRS